MSTNNNPESKTNGEKQWVKKQCYQKRV
jgi:hypothetical protein